MAFTTLDLLAAVVAALFSANAGAFYRLTFDNACAGLRITPEAYPQALSDGRVELLPGAVCAPLPKVVIDGLITNDKFCFRRSWRLKQRPPRRGYPDSVAEALEMEQDTVGPSPSAAYVHIPPLFMCEVS
jgi:hypothetical protein